MRRARQRASSPISATPPCSGPTRRPPDALRAAFDDYVYLRDNPAGPHRELWHHGAGCQAWLVVTRDTRTHEIFGVEPASRRSHAPAALRHDAPTTHAVRASAAAQPFRLPSGGLIDRVAAAALHASTAASYRAIPATRWPRRCSPTACGWSAAASSITGRAASSRPAPRSRTRWSSCAPARGASPTRARRRSSCTTGSRRAARTAGRRCASTCWRSTRCSRRCLSAGFYYKTFMWPAAFWEKVYEPLIRRAAGLGRAAGASRSRPLRAGLSRFCDVLVIGAGPAGLRRRWRPARSGARVILCEEDFRLGGRLLADRREIGGDAPASLGRAASRTSWRRCPTCALMPRTTVFGVYDGGTYGALERVTDHLPVPPPHEPRQRLWRIVAKRCVLAAGAIERPHRVRRQRPARRHAGRRRAHLCQPLRGRARPARRRSSPTTTTAGARRRSRARRHRGRGRHRSARRSVPAEHRGAAKPARARLIAGGEVIATRGRLARVRAVDGRAPRRARPRRIDCDLVCVSGGWSPTVHLTSPSRRPAGLERDASPPSCRARCRKGMAVAGAANGDSDAGATPCRRARRPALRGRGRLRLQRPARRRARAPTGRAPRVDAALARARLARQGVRRPPERRHRRRRRARRARGLPLGRAPQALHHARHGDRPGQDRQRQRPRASWPS